MQHIHLVLLPGLDGTGLLFRPLLQALAPEIAPIVVTYPAEQPLGYAELLELVLAALPKERPFVLLGESFGGPLALRVAATRPAGLKALILSASFVCCPYPLVPRWAAALVPDWPLRAFPALSHMKALCGAYATPALGALTAQALALVKPAVLAQRIRAVIQVDVRAELAACELPMLYLQGSHDLVVPAANLQRMLRIKPDLQQVQIAAPHMLLQTRPQQAAAAIRDFIMERVSV